jgi:hypothetical protein
VKKKAIKVINMLGKIGYLIALHSVLLPMIAISVYKHNKKDGKEEKKE